MDLLIIASLTFIVAFVQRIGFTRQWVWQVLFHSFPTLFLFIAYLTSGFAGFSVISQIKKIFLIYSLNFLSLDESDSLDDDGSGFGYYGTCSFPFYFDDSVGSVSGLGSGIFVPTGVKSKCEIFAFVVLVSIGSSPKVDDSSKKLALKFLIFPPSFKINFIVASPKTWYGALQWDLSVGLRILVAWVHRTPLSCNVLVAGSPRSMNCGSWVWTVSFANFVQQHAYRSYLEPSESLWPIIMLKMDAESISSVKFSSTTASNFWVFPPKPREMDFCFFATFRLQLRPQVGEEETISMSTEGH